jgi:hypothetical protein
MAQVILRNFVQMARDTLAPVLLKWGFHEVPTAETETELRYRNDVFDFVVGYNAYSFEIWVRMIPTQRSAESYSMSELMKLWKHPESSLYRDFSATNEPALRLGLKRLANLLNDLRALGMSATSGEIFKLRSQKAFLTQQLQDEIICQQARAMAEKAWQNHNFVDVVRSLSTIEAFLSEAEKKKLDFAKKHSKLA